jgi:hypothetical protein
MEIIVYCFFIPHLCCDFLGQGTFGREELMRTDSVTSKGKSRAKEKCNDVLRPQSLPTPMGLGLVHADTLGEVPGGLRKT